MNGKKFATAVNCMDGRTQLPLIEFVRSKTGVDYVDMITEPGIVKGLVEGKDQAVVQSVRNRIRISVEKHASADIWVAAHHDCAGNPVADEVQKQQAAQAVEVVRNWFPKVNVSAVWIDKDARAVPFQPKEEP